jgi:hypothetical protein
MNITWINYFFARAIPVSYWAGGGIGFGAALFYMLPFVCSLPEASMLLYFVVAIVTASLLGTILGAIFIYLFLARIGTFINRGIAKYEEGENIVVLVGIHKGTVARIDHIIGEREQNAVKFEENGENYFEFFFDFQIFRVKQHISDVNAKNSRENAKQKDSQ